MLPYDRHRCWIVPSVLLSGVLFSSIARAEVSGEAIPGRPFGVAKISFSGADVGAIDERLCRIEEKTGRAFYPAVGKGTLERLFNKFLGPPDEGAAAQVTIHFLFKGDEPLEMTLFTPARTEFTLRPRAAAERVFNRLYEQWWKDYQTASIQQVSAGEHPPLANIYLQTMLSRRLKLEYMNEVGPLGRLKAGNLTATASTYESMELLLGLEDLRLRTLRDSMLGTSDFGKVANRPLPEGTAWPPAALLPMQGDVPVEAIAAHVPPEYFYIRYGTFLNYLWLSDLMNDYGGDLGSMVTMRGYAAPVNKRVQDQLGLQQNELAKILGPSIISDVAMIGQDLYLVDGAAIGILFETKPDAADLLDDDILKQRRRALERERPRGAKEEKIKIRGRDVSLVSCPDNRVRSFYVRDGRYHLVTTSRTMAERFIVVSESKGAGSLAHSAEFRHARTILPLVRDDTIFAYLSKSFFEGLLTPQYQIELRRRMQSATDLDLLRFARLAAEGEGYPTDKFEPLIEAGFLPKSYGSRPDGSGPVIQGTELLDSLRGARGYFLPIADVPVVHVTADEAQKYSEQKALYERELKVLDPVMVGIKRFALETDGTKGDPQQLVERVTIDGHIAPLNESKYGFVMSMLGPPTTQMIARDPDDIISVQAKLKGFNLLGSIPPHQMFLGVQDAEPPPAQKKGGMFGGQMQMLKEIPGYLGSWPKAGYLDILPFGAALIPPPDENGFSQLPFGVWRREGGDFSVLSFQPDVLAKVTPNLRVTEAEIPAQIRIHVGDLHAAKIAPLINRLYYERAVATSSGNVRYLHMLNQQFHVPLRECFNTAQDILNAELKCTLSGEYELAREDGEELYWRSTGWKEKDAPMPEDYRAPLLDWFRGLDAHLTKQQGRLLVHAEVDLARKVQEKAPAPEFKLPLFDLFGGQKAFKSSDKAPKDPELPPPLPPVKKPPTAPKGKEF
jgi:hypothetical protein